MEGQTLTEVLRASVGGLLRGAYERFTGDALTGDPQARDFVVLDTLADQDADSQHELAERLGINRTIMVRLIDRLQEAGYVTRTRNPANRRSYMLSITEEGRAARDAMRQVVAERDARVTAVLTPDERQRLNELLSLLLPEPEPLQTTAYLVAQAHYRLRRMGDALLADVGLRTRHFGSLSAIAELGPCPQQRFARRLGISEPAAAQLVDELVRFGMVARGQDPSDRRRYALELTEVGRQRLTVVRDAAARLQADVLAVLGADAERELRALLTKLLTTKPPKNQQP
ncbi:MarR family transcriptional regulator [Nonomuraea glycinis]|uniref:MarR family transcriptional regulator n=1 Tax=Nonomuraea glycinis TaxID=2047744 RepID=UPI0033B2302E